MDIRENTARCNSYITHKLVQLLVIAHGKLHVARDDARLLVVTGGVAGQLEDLGAQVLAHGGHVDRGAGADARGVAALAQVAAHAAHRKLQARLSRAACGLAALLAAATLSFARHGVCARCDGVLREYCFQTRAKLADILLSP